MNTSHDTKPGRFWSFAASPVVQAFAVATILSLVIAAILGTDGFPFDRPAVATTDMGPNLAIQIVQIPVDLILIGVAFLVTRRRPAVDFDARTPPSPVARRETVGLLAYGAVVLVFGSWLGLGLHLHGSVFGPTEDVSRDTVYIWASYNFVFLAVIPYLTFRKRGYNNRALCLTSDNLRNDTVLIVAILVLESIVELTTFPDIFALSPGQLVIGIPATLVLHLLGTGIPVMIFVYAILFPRYMKLTGSAPAAVVLGALTYASLHVFEYWTVYDSLRNAILSLLFVFLQFAFPGLIKSFLTLRTGNAWVHLWGYHAIAPHVTVDTPLIVRIFQIR